MDRPCETPTWCWGAVACAAVLGLGLMAHQAVVESATYDESTYLKVASDWWQGRGTETITRMGSPTTFFKLQAGPVFWTLDRLGRHDLIMAAIENEATLLPMVRIGSLWIWLVAFGLTSRWSRQIYGPRAMAFAATLFALSPNLLAHGCLLTMELPLVAATTAMVYLFWRFLQTGSRRAFATSAAVGGLAFSCKFTTVLIPPILGLVWLVELWHVGERSAWRMARRIGGGMGLYAVILMVSNLVVTGFAMLPPSERIGDHPAVPGLLAKLVETPFPTDWIGFATQIRHQRIGGPSYLFGERRMTGWWYYYPVALAVKLPIACWLLLAARGVDWLRGKSIRRDWMLPLAIGLFLALAMLGSKRNYGVRYLLPLAPLAIVWISALAERSGSWAWVVVLGLAGQAVAVASIHPHELSYFNIAAGGPVGGRHILADSNLDWGQGLRSLAAIERRFPSLTLFYFGETDPARYGIKADTYVITANECRRPLPEDLRIATRYVAVSASLQYGPWGPDGTFSRFDRLTPVAYTDDWTIAIYDLNPAQ
jgi:hypothetical protein